MLSDGFFHEAVKACLVYDVDKIIKVLKERYRWRVIRKYRLIDARYEWSCFRDGQIVKLADAIWKFENGFIYVHEVKTGRFNLTEVVKEYISTRCMGKRVCGMARLCIWAWEECFNQVVTDFDVWLKIKYGLVSLLPIELIFPIVKDRVGKLYKRLESIKISRITGIKPSLDGRLYGKQEEYEEELRKRRKEVWDFLGGW
ncbi:MAG: hypothetical protein DRJ18_00255 [Candidatus Methanomethylicota archaeon]|nr:MAG: hypothetical protein DRJ18_00255 [Candidatus Verstraetearchaeota archaeon]